MSDENRLKELINKGKNSSLNNKELLEMIALIGPDKALEAVKQK